jgi:hypothetical protein
MNTWMGSSDFHFLDKSYLAHLVGTWHRMLGVCILITTRKMDSGTLPGHSEEWWLWGTVGLHDLGMQASLLCVYVNGLTVDIGCCESWWDPDEDGLVRSWHNESQEVTKQWAPTCLFKGRLSRAGIPQALQALKVCTDFWHKVNLYHSLGLQHLRQGSGQDICPAMAPLSMSGCHH